MIKRSIDTSWLDKMYGSIEKDELRSAKISVVKNVSSSNTSTLTTFGLLLDNIKNLESIEEVKEMKGWKHCGDKEKENKFIETKKNLPAFTLTTHVENGESLRKGTEIKNNYIIIDIDNIEINDEVFSELNSFYFVIGSGISVSGEGIYSIVKFDESVDNKDKFKEMFSQLEEFYKDRDFEIDKSCSNINRLRVISPYEFKWNREFEEPFCPSFKEEISTKSLDMNINDYDVNILGKDIIREPYEKGNMFWKRYGWSNTIYNCFGEKGKSLFMDIFYEDGDKDELEAIWKTSSRGDKESSSYCLRRLEEAGYLKKKEKIIKDEYDEIDAKEGPRRKMFSW